MLQVLKLLGVEMCTRGHKLLSKIEKQVCRDAKAKVDAKMKLKAERDPEQKLEACSFSPRTFFLTVFLRLFAGLW
jgi:hypothetical protein